MEVNVLENLVKYYHENKISHAYLIETNNLEKCYLDLLEVIKQIFCQNEYNKECNKCNICNLVNQNYLPSLVVSISPISSSSVDKITLMETSNILSTLPTIIKNAENLNGASANTMLKFLEEPEQNILGFFITNNANNVISTIRSRCEVIKVLYDIHELDINNITNDINKDKFDVAIEYLFKIEVEKKLGIMYNRDVVLNKFSEREDIKTVFKIIFIIYEELLKKVMGLDNKFDFEKINELSSLDKDKVLRRINLVTKFIDDIDSNVNVELLLDKFVIELGDYIE